MKMLLFENRNLNIWSLFILKNSKNQNMNKCIFKGKNLVCIFSPKCTVNFVFNYEAPKKLIHGPLVCQADTRIIILQISSTLSGCAILSLFLM